MVTGNRTFFSYDSCSFNVVLYYIKHTSTDQDAYLVHNTYGTHLDIIFIVFFLDHQLVLLDYLGRVTVEASVAHHVVPIHVFIVGVTCHLDRRAALAAEGHAAVVAAIIIIAAWAAFRLDFVLSPHGHSTEARDEENEERPRVQGQHQDLVP